MCCTTWWIMNLCYGGSHLNLLGAGRSEASGRVCTSLWFPIPPPLRKGVRLWVYEVGEESINYHQHLPSPPWPSPVFVGQGWLPCEGQVPPVSFPLLATWWRPRQDLPLHSSDLTGFCYSLSLYNHYYCYEILFYVWTIYNNYYYSTTTTLVLVYILVHVFVVCLMICFHYDLNYYYYYYFYSTIITAMYE